MLQVVSLQGHIHDSLVAYRHLSAAADGANEYRWNEVPKFHYFVHIGLQALYGNPRFHWCYMEEDFMGVLEDICAKCTEGTPAIEVVSKMLQKWLILSSLFIAFFICFLCVVYLFVFLVYDFLLQKRWTFGLALEYSD